MSRFSNIWNYLTTPSELLVVEHCLLADGVQRRYVQLKHSRGKLNVVDKGNLLEAAQMAEKWPKDLPMLLCISGKKVLSRNVPILPEGNLEVYLEQAFPNTPLDKLVAQDHYIGAQCSISAIRKDLVEEILDVYRSAGAKLIGLQLGLSGIIPLLEERPYKWRLGYHEVDLEKLEISLCETSEENEQSCLGENLPAHMLPAFLLGIQFYSEGDSVVKIAAIEEDWRFGVAYKKLLPIVAVSLLIILLGSFFTFNHYYGKNQLLQSSTAGVKEASKMLLDMRESVASKELFLKDNALHDISMASLFDQIAATVPNEVRLQAASLYPLEKEHKREQLLDFEQASLLLKGESRKYAAFKDWMEAVRGLPFVSSIEVLGFGNERDATSNEFSLRLKLRS